MVVVVVAVGGPAIPQPTQASQSANNKSANAEVAPQPTSILACSASNFWAWRTSFLILDQLCFLAPPPPPASAVENAFLLRAAAITSFFSFSSSSSRNFFFSANSSLEMSPRSTCHALGALRFALLRNELWCMVVRVVVVVVVTTHRRAATADRRTGRGRSTQAKQCEVCFVVLNLFSARVVLNPREPTNLLWP